ncbi:DoxX family protein [Spongisporangium articulatum]|uniref:DoxX family protein n=1 Tax=Spongisporangium articulatum TaxID=3362603 RepID=A0ABW8APV5_9ACTN
MTIVRRLARPLLAAPLIDSGVQAVRHPGPQAEAARPVLDQVTQVAPVQADPELIVRAAGGVTIVAGSLLALGKLPRLSALALVLTAPVVQTSQPFWQEKDPQLRAAQQTLFIKNLGLVGGALLAAVDTAGRPGVGYRTRKAAKQGAKETKRATKDAKRAAREARKTAALQAHKIVEKAPHPIG